MKFGKRLLACLTLFIVAVASALTFAACGEPDDNKPETPNVAITGEYYYDAPNGKEYTITFGDGYTFTLTLEEAMTGKYSYDGKTVTATLDNGGEVSFTYNPTAKSANVTYDGSTYTFIEKVEYTVKYNVNGQETDSVKVINGRTLVKPEDPAAAAGKTFVGWYKDQAYKASFAFGVERITSNVNLYARFIDTPQGAQEYEITFDLNGHEGTAPEAMTTIGGKVYNLPAVAEEGFLGWWVSAYNDGSKLTYAYAEQELEQKTTFFALWAREKALYVSVNGNEITWTKAGNVATYTYEIKNAEGETVKRANAANATSATFAFPAAGDYTVEVASNTGYTGTAYYVHNQLAPTVILGYEGNSLYYTAVKNATKYYINAECGTETHTHQMVDNGASLYYDFSACDMKEDGIKFTVVATAEGYLSSTSEEYAVIRNLEAAEGFAVDANELLTWNAVENATAYTITITAGGNTATYELAGATSYDLKEYAAGEITVSVKATGKGYNASTAEYTYTKTKLATPTGIAFEGIVITWNAVEGATGYVVNFDGTDYAVTEPTFTPTNEMLSSGKDRYDVTVKAVAANAANNSVASSVNQLSYVFDFAEYKNGALVWNAYAVADNYYVYLNDQKVAETKGTSYAFTFDKAGNNTVAVAYVDKNGTESEKVAVQVTTYAVTINYDGGTEYDVELPETKYLATGDALNLSANLVKRGYTFDAWYDEDDNKLTSTYFAGAEDATIRAGWTANEYTVKLHFDGDNPATEEETEETYVVEKKVTFGEAYDFGVNPTDSTLYAFIGWYNEPNNGGRRLTDATGASFANNNWSDIDAVDLYPGWSAIFKFNLISNGKEYSVEKGPGIGYVTEVTIPTEYEGLPVTTIEAGGFKSVTTLYKINIPDTIQDCSEGGANAFDSTTNLAEINIIYVEGNHTRRYASVDGVLFYRSIEGVGIVKVPQAKTGEYAIPAFIDFKNGGEEAGPSAFEVIPQRGFYLSKLSKVIVPYTTKMIDAQAFYSMSNLEEIAFEPTPEDTEPYELSFAAKAFQSLTKLTSITLPARLKDFPVDTFASCSNLAAINIDGTAGNYASINGVVTNAQKNTIVFVPVAFEGNEGKYVTPDGIMTIGEKAFNVNTKLKEIVISASVAKIEMEAFKGRTAITSLTFLGDENSNDLTIGQEAFYGLTNEAFSTLTLPANLTKLELNAFGGCTKLVSVSVTTNREEVDFATAAFGSRVTSSTTNPVYYVTDLYIAKTVPTFDVTGVFGASKLNNVTVEEGNPNYSSDESGVLFNGDTTKILFFPLTKGGEYVIPETVTEIGDNVFQGRTNLTKVTIGYKVASIGANAFNACTGLTEVIFEATPEGVEAVDLTIGDGAFRGMTNVSFTSIALPERTTELGSTVFYGDNKLLSITLPSTVKSIELGKATIDSVETEVFDLIDNCTVLQNIYVGNEYYTYESGKFYRYTLGENGEKVYELDEENNKVEFDVTKWAGNAYASIDGILYALDENGKPVTVLCSPRAKTGTVEIPSTVSLIFNKAFYYSGLDEIKFEKVDGEIELGIQSFYGNISSTAPGLKRITLPEGLKAIPARTFYDCSKLEEVVIPSTVETIDYCAFYYCTSLRSIIFAEDDTIAIEDKPALRFEDAKLPTGTTSSYSYSIFYYCNALTEIAFPERTAYIGSYMMTTARNLKKVTIPSTVVEIGDHAFYQYMAAQQSSTAYTSIEEIIFNTRVKGEDENYSDLTTIGDYAFGYTAIKSIAIPDSVTTLGSDLFYYDKQLADVTLPAGITALPAYLFYQCVALTEFDIPDGVTYIGSYAFSYTGISELEIPASIETIDYSAFSQMSKLNKVTFATDENGKSNLKTTGYQIFANTALTDFTFPETYETLTLGTTSGTGANITYNKKLFANCKELKHVHISSTISNIDDLFTNCSSITSVTIAEDNENFSAMSSDNTGALILNKDGTAIRKAVTVPANGELIIPEGMKEIGARAFDAANTLVKVTIPASLTTIGTYAFNACTELREVIVTDTAETPSNLNAIDTYTFFGCKKLESINLPASVTEIPGRMFYNCTSLTGLKLPSGVTSIGDYAFYHNDAMTSINIPASVTNIGSYAFQYCIGLEEFTLKAGVTYGTYLLSYSGVKKVTIEEGVETIPDYTFMRTANLTELTLPATVKKIGQYAFSYSDVAELNLSEGLESIGNYAFQYMGNIKEITIPASVKTVGTYLFRDSKALEKVTFAENSQVTTLGNYTFSGTESLKEVTLPANLAIGSKTTSTYLFPQSGIESIKLPAGVTVISDYMFNNCANLKSVEFEATIATVGSYAFNGCFELESIHDASVTADDQGNYANQLGATAVSYMAFVATRALETMALPNLKITAVGSATTNTSATYHAGIYSSTTTGAAIFAGSGLKTFEIPVGVTKIPAGMFYNCPNLTGITYADQTKVTGIGNYAFGKTMALETIQLPSALKPASTSEGTYMFTESALKEITFNSTMVNVPNYMFYNNTALEKVTFADNSAITTFGNYTFRGATNLKSFVANSAKLKTLGTYMFYDCTSLETVDLTGTAVTAIPNYCFEKCENLKTCALPDNVTSFGTEAFYGTTSLKEFTFPAKLAITSATSGTYAFRYSGITKAELPAGVTVIPNYFFANCDNLTSISFAGKLTTFGQDAFYSTTLNNFTIPETVTTIGQEAFNNTGLTEVVIGKNVTSIGVGAFAWCPVDEFQVDTANATYTTNAIGAIINKATNEIVMMPTNYTGDENGEFVVTSDMKIARQAFHGSHVKKIIIEDGLSEIGQYMFFNTAAEEIVIPDTVETIGSYAFASNVNLTKMTIPASVTLFNSYIFNNCPKLKEVTFAEGRTEIEGSSATSTLYMFAGTTNLETLNLPDTMTGKMGRGLFYNSATEKLVVNGKITDLEYAFYYASALKEVTLPATVKKIGQYAFGCSSAAASRGKLEKINWVGEDLAIEEIGYYAFQYQEKLAKFTIPATVKTIGQYALAYMYGLEELEFEEGFDTATYLTSAGATTALTYFVTNDLALKTVKLASTMTEIAPYMFYNCGLTSVEIPANVVTIGKYAFSGNGSSDTSNPCALVSVKFAKNNKLETIGDYAFQYGKYLTEINLEDCENLTSIGMYAFSGCTALKSLIIPANVDEILQYCFKGMTEDQTIYMMAAAPGGAFHSDWLKDTSTTPCKVTVIWGYELPATGDGE